MFVLSVSRSHNIVALPNTKAVFCGEKPLAVSHGAGGSRRAYQLGEDQVVDSYGLMVSLPEKLKQFFAELAATGRW